MSHIFCTVIFCAVVQQREANEAAQRLQRVTEQKANNERAKFEVEHRSFVDSFGAITGCSNVEVMRRFYSTYGNDTEVYSILFVVV